MKKKILILTGTRADYGKLKSIILALQKLKNFETHVLVTGIHNLKFYGYTYLEIIKDKIKNVHILKNQSYGDKPEKIFENSIKVSRKIINRVKPELIIVHGDRIEPLALSIVANLKNIKLAHFEGGEVSGTIDESIRHAITKLSHIHFVTNKKAKVRIQQLGEDKKNIFITGSPDVDLILSKRLPSILPPMSLHEALETTKIHSILGLINDRMPLIVTRPFRSPHHTISDAGLIGGGRIPKPGEVSLSHHGVLFLDELPEFRRNVLEVMRQPLEDGEVTISRASAALTYPSDFMLVAAMNPCPCGFFGDTSRNCQCNSEQIKRYVSKISGPLLDRIDIQIEVPAVKYQDLADSTIGEPSVEIRQRVQAARSIQVDRFTEANIHSNASMRPKEIRQYCQVTESAQDLLRVALDQLGLSARAYDRILKVSRTIADLDHSPNIRPVHVSEAIQYRSLDRNYWQ